MCAALPGTHNFWAWLHRGLEGALVTSLGNYLPLKKNISEKLRAKGRRESLCGFFCLFGFFWIASCTCKTRMTPSGIFLQDGSSYGLTLAFLNSAMMFKVKCLPGNTFNDSRP